MELASGGGPYDWFFLAMAMERLGQRDEALRWYERGRTWPLQQEKADPDVDRWRAEAADLLGIANAKK